MDNFAVIVTEKWVRENDLYEDEIRVMFVYAYDEDTAMTTAEQQDGNIRAISAWRVD